LYVCLFAIISVFSKDELIKAFSILTNYLFIIVLVSLPLWFIHTFIFQLPSYGTIDLAAQKGAEYVYENYLFFVTCSGLEQFRFYSIFDEPGALGTLSAFVLYGNKYNFRDKRLLVILAGGIFTYSLAFYILTIIGFIASCIISRVNAKPLFFAIAVVCAAFYYLQSDETFQTVLLGRFERNTLEIVESRTEESINKYFEKHISDSEMIFGIGENGKVANGLEFGSSYKLFVIENGWVGLFLMIIMYALMRSPKNIMTLMSYVLVFLSFLQRPYLLIPWIMVLYMMINANLCNEYSRK
jgi:hypothetical protein